MNINQEKRGSALIITMIVMVTIVTLSGTFVMLSVQNNKMVLQAEQYERCYGILRAGVSHAVKLFNQRTGTDGKVDTTKDNVYENSLPNVTIGAKTYKLLINWTDCGGGQYKVLEEKLGLGRFKLLVYARIGSANRRAIVMTEASGDSVNIPGEPFVHALYSGGTQNPLNWGGTLDKNGTNRTDEIHSFPPPANQYRGTYSDWSGATPTPGNIYAGKKLDIHQDGYLAPGAKAQSGGVITETSTRVEGTEEEPSSTQVKLVPNTALENPEPPDYTKLADVIQVKPADFTKSYNDSSEGTVYLINKPWSDKGKAQSDPTNIINDPRHIFIKNPSNHNGTSKKNGDIAKNGDTTRDDFYIDDLFHSGTNSPSRQGGGGVDQESKYNANSTSNTGYKITLAPSGNNKIYLIDGNLWLHNLNAYSFMLKTTGTEGSKITLAVKGSVFLSDNLLYENLVKDAIAIVALKQPEDFPDDKGNKPKNPTNELSGDIRFGDANYGTTYRFCSFMYAENNFYTYNVANNLYVYGNMTAGNEVNISNGVGSNRKSLVIHYDARLQRGDISLPGLPSDPTKKGSVLTYYEENSFDVRGMSETSKGSPAEWQ